MLLDLFIIVVMGVCLVTVLSVGITAAVDTLWDISSIPLSVAVPQVALWGSLLTLSILKDLLGLSLFFLFNTLAWFVVIVKSYDYRRLP